MKKAKWGMMMLTLVLTAQLGRVTYNGHYETWYNLPMQNIVNKAHDNGIDGKYWVSGKGLKMLGEYVMCAGSIERYGEVVETSLGVKGIIVDTGDFVKTEPDTIDIATNW